MKRFPESTISAGFWPLMVVALVAVLLAAPSPARAAQLVIDFDFMPVPPPNIVVLYTGS